MLKIFEGVGIRFFRTNSAFVSIETNYRLKPFAQQSIYGYYEECYRQPIRFNDISRLQIWSSSAVTVVIRNAAGSVLQTTVVPLAVANFLGFGVYNLTINWGTISGLNAGSYITISNADNEYARSEPLRPYPHPLLKIEYKNLRSHTNFGNYAQCYENIFYAPANIADYDIAERDVRYENSALNEVLLVHDKYAVAKLYTDAMPYYMHVLLRTVLKHDIVLINGVPYRAANNYELDTPDRAILSTADCTLREVDSGVRRVVSQRNTFLPVPPVFTPETNITATGFCANWEAQENADSYDVQLSTTPDFSVIAVSVNVLTNTYCFTGLTPCVKYYYRARAINCVGTSAWATNSNEKQISIHFRDDDKWAAREFDEKITDLRVFNIFSVGTQVRYKYAPVLGVSKTDWDTLYTYRTLAQIQSDITAGGSTYSLYFDIQGYAQGSDAGLVFLYRTPSFWLTVGCLTYQFRYVSRDVVLFFRGRVSLDSVTSGNTPASTYRYKMLTSATGLENDMVDIGTNLAALNAQLAAAAGERAVIVHCEFAGTAVADVTTFNISYLE